MSKVFLALWVFTMLIGLMLALICSCAERVVAPTDGVATVEVAGIVVTFNFEESSITVENTVDEIAIVNVGRWNDDANDFLTIFQCRLYGYWTLTKHAVFSHGDYVRIKVNIGGTEIPPECFTLG